MQNADMKPNRLFSVALSANSGNRLSAATFEFTYDPDYIEFRKVKAVNNGSKIQVNKKSGNIKVVFLNSEGQNISGGSDVLTLDFKLQERAVKVNTRPSLQLLMPQMTNILITIPLKIGK